MTAFVADLAGYRAFVDLFLNRSDNEFRYALIVGILERTNSYMSTILIVFCNILENIAYFKFT